MAQSLTLSRAARLVHTSRGELQARIEAGELTSFEGKVELDALMRLYPQAGLGEDPELQRMAAIRAAALHKPPPDDSPMAWAILHQRIAELEGALADARGREQHYRRALEDTSRRLTALQEDCDERLKVLLEALAAWVTRQLRRASSP